MSNYKENISWLNELPPNWSVAPIRSVIKQVNEKRQPDLQLLSVYRDYGVILKDSRDDNHNKPGEDLNNYKVVKPGQLVINKMKTWQGSLGVSDYLGIVSPAYLVSELKGEVNKRYLHYLLRSHPYIFEYNRISYGVRVDQWDLKWEYFKKLPLLIPPRKEQDAIVKFLDKKLADIDKYIFTKQKQIELLNEQKAAIINKAVTKGLDPNTKMKDSGVEWLGEVPKDWKIKPLKHWIYMNRRALPDDTDEEFEYDYLDIGNVVTGKIVGEIERYKFINAPSRARRIVLDGDTIISTVRTYLKAVLFITSELSNHIVSTGFAVLTPRDTILPYFLFLAVQNHPFINTVTINSVGANYPAINPTKLGSLKLVAPSNTKEQAEIIKYIKLKAPIFDEAISSLYKEIKLINDYKNSLISEAVTGKIKVI